MALGPDCYSRQARLGPRGPHSPSQEHATFIEIRPECPGVGHHRGIGKSRPKPSRANCLLGRDVLKSEIACDSGVGDFPGMDVEAVAQMRVVRERLPPAFL